VNEEVTKQVLEWIEHDPDTHDRATLQKLLSEGNEVELRRRFDSPLTFGTAGLRGPVMAGPAGMNRFTVRRATQGVIRWLQELEIDPSKGVVVGRDARHGSEAFNDEAVAVLLGAGVRVYEMISPLPTPYVAAAVKSLNAGAGIMITASHNPPNDNGYKLYASDGSQIIAPNDEMVEQFAREAITPVLGERTSENYFDVPSEVIAKYQNHMLSRFSIKGGSSLRITYTPLHGVGGDAMMTLFRAAGYSHVTVVSEQFAPDGNFPTLAFPNPEEPGALDLAIATADGVGSSLIIANDPDADRLGVAVKDNEGWHILRGDEIGWLLGQKLLPDAAKLGQCVATTIVSSTLLSKMAKAHSVKCATTLTGFKWIARGANDKELAFGYEEALGYGVDPSVGDKDGLSAALALCQIAHEAAQDGKTLLDVLDKIESQYGVHAGAQISLRSDDLARITDVMQHLRSNPPKTIAGMEVTGIVDFANGYEGLASADCLSYQLSGTDRVVVRPSGTEAKLKVYIEVVRDAGSDVAAARKVAKSVVNELGESITRLLAL
jgi:phosphomannomutase